MSSIADLFATEPDIADKVAPLVGFTSPTVASLVYALYPGSPLGSSFMKNPDTNTSAAAKDAKEFIKFINEQGIKTKPLQLSSFPFAPPNAAFVPPDSLPGHPERFITWSHDRLPGAGILAHEYGHAKNYADLEKKFGKSGTNFLTKYLFARHPVMRNIRGLAGLASLITAMKGNKDDVALGAGLIGSAIGVPQLIEETVASARGYNALKKLKLKGKWKAFSGLPTYAAATLAPLAPWLGKKIYEKSKN